MTDPVAISLWKRIAIRSFFGGVGVAITLGIITGAAIWYQDRPKQWNASALKATFDTLEITTAQPDGYPVDFYYNVKNNTNRNYSIEGVGLTTMAVLTDGNVLSKEFGHYQTSDASIQGPAFIPPGGTVRISVHISYRYPDNFKQADKEDGAKIMKGLDYRLRELSGFVIFDNTNHYRIDLPEGWKGWDSVKEEKSDAASKP